MTMMHFDTHDDDDDVDEDDEIHETYRRWCW